MDGEPEGRSDERPAAIEPGDEADLDLPGGLFDDDELDLDLPDEVFDDDDDADADAEEALADAPPEDAPLAPLATPIVAQPWAAPVRRFRWLTRLVVLAAVAAPTAVVVSVVSSSSSGDEDGPPVDRRLADALRYDRMGDPVVLTPTTQLGIGTVRRRAWRVCGSRCAKASGRGAQFSPGVVKSGSRIELTITGSRGARRIVSPTWLGQLTSVAPPQLKGEARVGGTVSAGEGDWLGGWAGATKLTGLRACPTAAGGGRCIAFTPSILRAGTSDRRTIPESFRGWYVGAIEWQLPPLRTPRAGNVRAPVSPEGALRAPLPSATVVASELVGPVS